MAVTGAELLSRVGGAAADAGLADKIVALAVVYVEGYQLAMSPDPEAPYDVPAEPLDNAVMACAEDIWNRTKSENGVMLTSYQPGDDGPGVVIRIGRDPLAPVRPLLALWIPTVFAL